MIALALALALTPLHGIVISAPAPGAAVIRSDEIPATLQSLTMRVRLNPPVSFRAGDGIDGFLDRTTTPWTLRDALAAAPFSPGVPDQARATTPVDVGKTLPHATLVDQTGTPLDLASSFNGKTMLLSFIFTRCPDRNLCPAISAKYAYLQSHLDPKHFTLVEISLDPQYDSPSILHAYGVQYGAIAKRWFLLTSTGSTTQRLLDAFGIDSMRVSTANFIHNDKLYIVTPQGRVAYIVDTAGWDPDGVIAEASSVAGMASNPLERLKLSLIASVVALCGGSQFAGVVLLEIALFFVVLIFVAAGLWVVARVLWGGPHASSGKTQPRSR